MPTEPNRNADEELKRYAEERRRQPAPELHPATRRMLQGEIGRTYKKEATKESWWSRWMISPAMSWQLSVVAMFFVIFVVGALVLRTPSPTREEAPAAKSLEQPKAVVESVAPPVTREPAGTGGMAGRDEAKTEKAPAAMPAGPRVVASADAEQDLRFLNTAPAQESLNVHANVMNNFQLQRVGARGVRFVDQDQSVYTGTVVASRGITNLFRAEGANRTLQSPVVITGQYYRVDAPLPQQQQLETRARYQQQEQLRLQGQAMVGATNQVQIEAQSGVPSQ